MKIEGRLECAAILFDLDGVLVDSTIAVERAWRDWAAKHDLRFEDVILHAHGRRTVETIAAAAPHLDARAETLALEDDEISRAREVAPLAGAHDLLEQLDGARWAIVTSGSRRLAVPRIEACGIPLPPALVTGDDVVEGKPHPEGYAKAAEALGVAATDCVVFEDAPAGLQAARSAGAHVIGLTTTYSLDELDGADGYVDSLAAISATVRPDGTIVLSAT
jgi:sugar-phosphatase